MFRFNATYDPVSDDPDLELLSSLRSTWQTMLDAKPNDRSERDRRYAIAITKMQDLVAWVKAMIVDDLGPGGG